jgi:hypothetical protein
MLGNFQFSGKKLLEKLSQFGEDLQMNIFVLSR